MEAEAPFWIELLVRFQALHWKYLLGYAFSVLGSVLLVRPIVTTLWKQVESDQSGIRAFPWHSAAVGTVEVVLYTSAVVASGQYLYFIPAWLLLKTAGRWALWEKGTERVWGRTIFLIGSGFSLACGVAGGTIASWAISDRWPDVVILAVAFTVFALAFRGWICCQCMKGKS